MNIIFSYIFFTYELKLYHTKSHNESLTLMKSSIHGFFYTYVYSTYFISINIIEKEKEKPSSGDVAQ